VSWLLDLLPALWDAVLDYTRRHPMETAIVLLAFLRMFGTTVQTGTKGVLFVFGRVRKELEPGFHPLIPIVHAVRKTPVRSITLDLPTQWLTTADGLVYEVQANIVYHIADPTVSMVQIDNVRQGIEVVLSLIVQDLLRDQSRATLAGRLGLDEEFAARAEDKLRRWGVAVEQAGFKSIAPTKKTLRLTQLALLTAEREKVLRGYEEAGLSPDVAMALLGADRHLVGRATARYRGLRRRLSPWPWPPPAPEQQHAQPATPDPWAEPPPDQQAEGAPAPSETRRPSRVRGVRGLRSGRLRQIARGSIETPAAPSPDAPQ
jgi:hypothetical protein